MREKMRRFDEYMTFKGLNDNRVTVECGLSQGLLGQARTGKSDLGNATIQKILNVYQDLSRVWLLTGEGPMLTTSSTPKPTATNRAKPVATYIPLIPVDAFAGPIARLLEVGVVDGDCRSVISPVAGAEMAIPVSGDSMEPAIHDGSVLYIARINDRAFIPWGNIMVIDTENGALVKELYPVDGDNSVVEARSLNTKYPPFIIPKDSIRGIYRVLGVAKFHSTL